MNTSHDQQSEADSTAESAETTLSDDLLTPGEQPEGLDANPTPPVVPTVDDDDYLAPEGRRSRWTTGLAVALIFAVGILCGVALTKALSPTPPAQVVYVLNDTGGGSAAPAPSVVPSGGPARSTDTPR